MKSLMSAGLLANAFAIGARDLERSGLPGTLHPRNLIDNAILGRRTVRVAKKDRSAIKASRKQKSRS